MIFAWCRDSYNLVIRSGSAPTALAFSPSPKTYCAIASKDKVIRVIDIGKSVLCYVSLPFSSSYVNRGGNGHRHSQRTSHISD